MSASDESQDWLRYKWATIGLFGGLAIATIMFFATQDARDPERYKDDVKIISSVHAADFIGRGLIVEGRIAEIKKWRGVTYVNFDKPFPNQTFALMIPPEKSKLLEALPGKGQTLAVGGMIQADKRGKPFIIATGYQTIDPNALEDTPEDDRTGIKGMPY